MREAYFHEDDYCQIELLPLSTWTYCASELQKIGNFSQSHAEGAGWTDIYLRDENPLRIANLGLHTKNLASMLEPQLPSYDRVLTGYSSYREESKQTLAFGTESACIVYASYDDSNVIQDIWLDLGLADQANIALAQRALSALAGLADLLLVDWESGSLLELSNPDQIMAYFESRVQGHTP